MKKGYKAIILGITIIVSVMILVFTIMLIRIGNYFKSTASSSTEKLEASFDVKNSVLDEEKPDTEMLVENELIEESDYKIYMSDMVDLDLDDTAINDVEYENSFVNTTELLPSLFYEREVVDKSAISTENFPSGFLSDYIQRITFTDSTDSREQQAVSFPTEVFLYNVDGETSNSCEVHAMYLGSDKYVKSIGWSSEDSSIIALNKTSGDKVTVTRVKDFVGVKNISVVVTYYTNLTDTATATLKIQVHCMDVEGQDICLYDKDNEPVYTDPLGKHPATLNDYPSAEKFYGAVRLWGWQTIEDKTYYFNRKGWAVTGNQIIGGTQYAFSEEGELISSVGEKGIDVSLYQREIDWEQVAASGISFAIIRCGFRGSVTAKLVEDACFRRNIEGAKAAGIKVGVYFFTQAITEQEAAEEAAMVLKLCKDYSLDLPIFIDSENARNGRANGLDADSRTKILVRFCKTITDGGRQAGVYASKSWYYHKVHADELEPYVIWVAQYNTECNYTGKKNLWQYSSKEHVNGIEGYVDMDIFY